MNKLSKLLSLIFIFSSGLTNSFYFSSEKLRPDNERFIRNIINELGMSGLGIKIVKMNFEEIARFGRDNAFANYKDEIHVSEDFFDELSKEEKRFVIGHELMHIKCKHIKKSIGLSLVASLISRFGYAKFRDKYILKKYGDEELLIHKNPKTQEIIKEETVFNENYKTMFLESVSVVSIGLLSTIVKFQLSRYDELEADREAVLKLNAFDGGIKFLKRFDFKKFNFNNKEQSYIVKKLLAIFSTHPSDKARIEQIENLKRAKNFRVS